MKETRIMFFGTPEFAVRILETLVEEKYNVIATVSQPDRPVGRKHRIEPTPVHACSMKYDIPCLQPEKLKDISEEIKKYQPELIMTCAYGQFIPSSILSLPIKGCLNIHPSLLPKYRGGAPIQHAVMNGDTETGVSLMEMITRMDAGRIYACYHTEIGKDETFGEVNERLMDISCQLVKEQLPLYLEGKLEGHISLANGWLNQVAEKLHLEDQQETVFLHHMILSHHGHYEFGSPVLPMLQEAEALSLIDNLDARMNTLKQALDATKPDAWTSKLFALENRQFYKPKD